MFLLDYDILTSLAPVLKKSDPTLLPPYWTTIVGAAHSAAYQDIYEALIRRGFTATQIAAWDRGAEFEDQISLFYALVKGAGMHGYDATYVKMLDRRRELATVEVYNGGVWQAPGGPTSSPGQAFVDTQERHNHGFGPLPHSRWFNDEAGAGFNEWWG